MRVKTKQWHGWGNTGRIISFTQNGGTSYAIVLMDFSKDYYEKYKGDTGTRLKTLTFDQFDFDPPDLQNGILTWPTT